MKVDLPDSVRSPEDLKSLILEVKEYARFYSHYSVKAQVSPNQPAESPPTILPVAAELINEVLKDSQNPAQTLDDLIGALSELDDSLPRLTLTLVGPATTKVKDALVKWSRTNLEPNLLVDFKFNSTILGGLVVQYGSHIYDYSWRQQILANLPKFPEVLRRV